MAEHPPRTSGSVGRAASVPTGQRAERRKMLFQATALSRGFVGLSILVELLPILARTRRNGARVHRGKTGAERLDLLRRAVSQELQERGQVQVGQIERIHPRAQKPPLEYLEIPIRGGSDAANDLLMRGRPDVIGREGASDDDRDVLIDLILGSGLCHRAS
jgi:hypothetical protein